MGLPPASHHARGRHDGLALHHEHAAQEEEALESALSELERFVHAALEDRRNGRRARPSPHTAEEGMTGDGGSIWPDRSVVTTTSGESEGVPERLSISRIMLEKELQRMREMEARESEWELCVGGKARKEPELSISEMIEEEGEVTSSASSGMQHWFKFDVAAKSSESTGPVISLYGSFANSGASTRQKNPSQHLSNLPHGEYVSPSFAISTPTHAWWMGSL